MSFEASKIDLLSRDLTIKSVSQHDKTHSTYGTQCVIGRLSNVLLPVRAVIYHTIEYHSGIVKKTDLPIYGNLSNLKQSRLIEVSDFERLQPTTSDIKMDNLQRLV